MDLDSLIASFATGTYTVTRTARATPQYGQFETGTQTTFTITASVSPLGTEDLERLPEGRRTTEARMVFSTTLLSIGGKGAAYEADVVSIGGEDFEVSDHDEWVDPVSGGTAFKYLVLVVR